MNKVRTLEEETEAILAVSLLHQLDEPTGGKTILVEQKQLVEKLGQYQFFNTPGAGARAILYAEDWIEQMGQGRPAGGTVAHRFRSTLILSVVVMSTRGCEGLMIAV